MNAREWASEFNTEALFADGFDSAIIGVAERCSQPFLVVYDAERCIEILAERTGMGSEDAAEFFSFNVSGAWMGENTPLFLWRLPPQEKGKTLCEVFAEEKAKELLADIERKSALGEIN